MPVTGWTNCSARRQPSCLDSFSLRYLSPSGDSTRRPGSDATDCKSHPRPHRNQIRNDRTPPDDFRRILPVPHPAVRLENRCGKSPDLTPNRRGHIVSPYFRTPLETFENLLFTVTPAKAGVQNVLKSLDSGFHRNDDLSSFGRNSKVSALKNARR